MKKLTIAVFTTVFKRMKTTEAQMKWMYHFRSRMQEEYSVEIIPFYVISSFDMHKQNHLNNIQFFGFRHHVSSEDKLSSKSQDGLNQLKELQWDYLIHLDSDELMSDHMMMEWIEYMNVGLYWFACKEQVFYVPEDQKAYLFKGYKRMKYVNGGHCIHRSLFEKMQWIAWTRGLQFGLNVNEYRHLERTGKQVCVQSLHERGTVEIKRKTGICIHDMNWYRREQELEELTGERLISFNGYFPNLKNYFQ